MAYDPGAIDATLAAAVGDDPGLIAELRIALVDSAERAVEAMAEAHDAEGWSAGALRLRGLAASFGAVRLMALAGESAITACGDPAVIARLKRAIDRL